MDFWSSFWPNFAATTFGVILALPLGLWTNKIIIAAQENKKAKNEREDLKDDLLLIKQVLTDNRAKIASIVAALEANSAKFDTKLDISAWDAIKLNVVKNLRDGNLKKRIAYHFSRLQTLTELNAMYLDLIAGITSALGGAENTRDALKVYLNSSAKFLLQDTDEIVTLINDKTKQ